MEIFDFKKGYLYPFTDKDTDKICEYCECLDVNGDDVIFDKAPFTQCHAKAYDMCSARVAYLDHFNTPIFSYSGIKPIKFHIGNIYHIYYDWYFVHCAKCIAINKHKVTFKIIENLNKNPYKLIFDNLAITEITIDFKFCENYGKFIINGQKYRINYRQAIEQN